MIPVVVAVPPFATSCKLNRSPGLGVRECAVSLQIVWLLPTVQVILDGEGVQTAVP